MSRSRIGERGVTLVELLFAMAIGAAVLAALVPLVSLAVRSQDAGNAANEQVYLAGFALERMTLKTRASQPRFLSDTPADNTGTWLSPLMYCLSKDSPRLIETTSDDTSCTGGVVLAEGVTAFSAVPASGTRAVDGPVIVYNLTVAPAGAPKPVTLTASVRVGGGTQ